MLPPRCIWFAWMTIALDAGGRLAKADVPGDPLTESGEENRYALTIDELMDAAGIASSAMTISFRKICGGFDDSRRAFVEKRVGRVYTAA